MKKLWTVLGIGLGIPAAMVGAAYVLPDRALWLVPFTPVVLFLMLIGYRLPEDNLKKWSKAHGIAITPENRSLIVRYLGRGRRIRTTGAALGCVGYVVFTTQLGRDEASWGVLRSIFLGYLIGAAVAEVWALRLRPQGSLAASLAPRQARDYLPRPAILLLRAVPVATVLLAAFWEWIPVSRDRFGLELVSDRPGLGWIGAWAGLSVAVAFFVEAAIRRIVRRPQPAVSVDLIAVDDAIRSTSIHQLAGAGLALLLGIFSARMEELTPDTSNVLNALFGTLGLFTGLGSIFAWLHLGVDQPWVVRRSQPIKAAA